MIGIVYCVCMSEYDFKCVLHKSKLCHKMLTEPSAVLLSQQFSVYSAA